MTNQVDLKSLLDQLSSKNLNLVVDGFKAGAEEDKTSDGSWWTLSWGGYSVSDTFSWA